MLNVEKTQILYKIIIKMKMDYKNKNNYNYSILINYYINISLIIL